MNFLPGEDSSYFKNAVIDVRGYITAPTLHYCHLSKRLFLSYQAHEILSANVIKCYLAQMEDIDHDQIEIMSCHAPN